MDRFIEIMAEDRSRQIRFVGIGRNQRAALHRARREAYEYFNRLRAYEDGSTVDNFLIKFKILKWN